MIFMEKSIIPNRRNVSYDALITAGNMVGIPINTSCRNCAGKSGTDLLNKYGQLKHAWGEYKKTSVKEVVTTAYEDEIIKQLDEQEVSVIPEKLKKSDAPYNAKKTIDK